MKYEKTIAVLAITFILSAMETSFATERCTYQDFLVNGASAEHLVEALKCFSYS